MDCLGRRVPDYYLSFLAYFSHTVVMPWIMSAAFSAIITVVAMVLAVMAMGMTEASTTRSLLMPWTLRPYIFIICKEYRNCQLFSYSEIYSNV